MTQQRWGDAEPNLTAIQAEIRGERDLLDLAGRTVDLLAQARQGRTAQETRSRDQERLRTFSELRRDTLFHETHFPGLDLPYDPETVRTHGAGCAGGLRRAGLRRVLGPGVLPESLSPREHDEIKRGLLRAAPDPGRRRTVARAGPAAPGPGGAAAAVHPGSPTCGGPIAWPAGAMRSGRNPERKTGRRPSRSSRRLDHFLIGKELYEQEDWAAALPHFDAALMSEPGSLLGPLPLSDLQHPAQPADPGQGRAQRLPPGRAPARLALRAAGIRLVQDRRSRPHGRRELAGPGPHAPHRDPAPTPGGRGRLRQGPQAAGRRSQQRPAVSPAGQPRPALARAPPVGQGRGGPPGGDPARRPAVAWRSRIWPRSICKQNQSDQAIEQFTRAITLRPDWAPLYRGRAAGEPGPQSIHAGPAGWRMADLDEAIRLEPPGSPDLALDYTKRARLLHQEAREEEALAACEAALKINPDYLDAHPAPPRGAPKPEALRMT